MCLCCYAQEKVDQVMEDAYALAEHERLMRHSYAQMPHQRSGLHK